MSFRFFLLKTSFSDANKAVKNARGNQNISSCIIFSFLQSDKSLTFYHFRCSFSNFTQTIIPPGGEYIRIYKKGEIRKIYVVFARFEKDKAIFETDKSFLESKNSV